MNARLWRPNYQPLTREQARKEQLERVKVLRNRARELVQVVAKNHPPSAAHLNTFAMKIDACADAIDEGRFAGAYLLNEEAISEGELYIVNNGNAVPQVTGTLRMLRGVGAYLYRRNKERT